MEKPDKRVYIKVHPAVKKYLEKTQLTEDGVIYIKEKVIADMLTSFLEKTNYTTNDKVSRLYEKKYEKICMAISNRIFYSIGWEMTPFWQCQFSNFVYRRMLDEICMTVMTNTICRRGNKKWIIEEFLAELDMDEDQVKYSAVWKHYQRNYREKEERIRKIIEIAGQRQRREKKL